jgi:ubiquinone/menaquinone biosynthesis C-methylase UbiE
VERLADTPELLDGPLATVEDLDDLAGNLRDLRRVNRLLGGITLSARALEALAPDGEPVTMLDVGTGAVDIPVALMAQWRRRGRRLVVTAVEDRREVLDAAIAIRPGLALIDGLRLEVADGRRLPYPDGAFEVAHASLVLHHLEPPDAIALLREMRRVASRGVVVNDLSRGRLAWLGAWLMTRVATRNRLTRNDAPLSVRRAYTTGEARALLAEAGLRPVHVSHGFARHRFTLAAVAT